VGLQGPGDQRPEILPDRMVWHPEGATEPLTFEIREIVGE
jgi:hypothetical protein